MERCTTFSMTYFSRHSSPNDTSLSNACMCAHRSTCVYDFRCTHFTSPMKYTSFFPSWYKKGTHRKYKCWKWASYVYVLCVNVVLTDENMKPRSDTQINAIASSRLLLPNAIPSKLSTWPIQYEQNMIKCLKSTLHSDMSLKYLQTIKQLLNSHDQGCLKYKRTVTTQQKGCR